MKQNFERSSNISNYTETNITRNVNKKTCIVFETNTLRGSLDFESPFNIKGNLSKIQEILIELNIVELVDLVVPDIVIEETRRQYIENYNSNVNKLKSIFKNTVLPGIKLDYDETFNVEEYTLIALETIRKTLLQEYGILTNMSMYGVSFNSILERALEKRRPFEGKKGQSDKGFKDAVLWENIINYREKYSQYEVILFSKDYGFDQSLVEEFQSKFNESIKIIDNNEEIYSYLISISEKDSSSLLEEIEKSHYIKKFLQDNINNLQLQYKHWLEDKNAYGSGIRIFEITDLTIDNLLPAEFSSYHIDGDYFALAEVRARGSNNGIDKSFNSNVYLDILFNSEHSVSFEITGLTLSEEN